MRLDQRFRARAQATPDAVALKEGDRSVTYGELRDRAGRIAGALRARGVGDGDLVGLHLERSVEWVAAVLGVLESGAAVLPLPPSYPHGQLRRILELGAPRAVLDDARTPLDAALRDGALRLEELAAETPAPAPDGRTGHPGSPAFVLCSSGSTGRPKLIVRSHRSFAHRLEWTWSRHPFEAGELGCQKAHMTTTHAIYELLEPLLAGAPVLLVPDDQVRDLEGFWQTLETAGVTRLLIVPSALRASLDMPGFRPPPLKVVVLMGEALPDELARRAARAFPPSTRLYSIYGSTEASSTLVVDVRAALAPDQGLPLGTPLQPEVQALVLGPDLEPVPPGTEGRLHIAGPPLFDGYHGDPQRTAEVLVEPPGGGGPLYDTRDRVLRQPDGALRFVGRVDHLVKIRGFPVDLPEVERALLQHPQVAAAAAVVDDGGAEGGGSLLGFYAPATAERNEVYRTLREALPPYMVPSALVALDALPRTPSGKVDRVRLLALYRDGASGASVEGEALGATELQVVDIWARTLGHTHFGRHSSFFEVGGTSLNAFEVVHRLRGAFHLDRRQLPPEMLYRHATLAGLAGALDALLRGDEADVADEATPLLVTLRGGADPALEPLFVLASAGGTVGAYEKLARALATPRPVIGVRDPYLWGGRDPGEGFGRWVERYLKAIRQRQPAGPYYLCAYSSAGAFGWEVARRLRADGDEVALLAMVDPLALDRSSRWRFGYWALRATWMRPQLRALVRAAGRVRGPAVRLVQALGQGGRKPSAPDGDFRTDAGEALRNRGHILGLSALLELNTGLPFTLDAEDLEGADPDAYVQILQARMAELMPEVDGETVRRLAFQYELQVRTQHAYRLGPYRGRVVLVEPASRYAGLVATLLRPRTRRLEAHVVPVGEADARTAAITGRFGALATHYRSMRDATFVQGLARVLDEALSS